MYKEFIKCNHGYSNVESVYDFLPLYCYNDDINKKFRNKQRICKRKNI